MPRLLCVGHVSMDRRPGGEVLGGSVSYGSLAARRLGWEVAILSSAGPDFDPERELPGVPVFLQPSAATTRFVNEYDADGTRHQTVTARADDIHFEALPGGVALARRAAARPARRRALGRLGHRVRAPTASARSRRATCARSTPRAASRRSSGCARSATCWACTCCSSRSTTCRRPRRGLASCSRSSRSWRSRAAGAVSRS